MAGFQLLAIISMCHKQILLKTFSLKTHTHTHTHIHTQRYMQKFSLLFLIFCKNFEELNDLHGTFQLMSLFEAIFHHPSRCWSPLIRTSTYHINDNVVIFFIKVKRTNNTNVWTINYSQYGN